MTSISKEKQGRKVCELVHPALLNSFSPEGMDDFFWDFVGLVNNTKSKEESKSQKIRLRGLYDTIVDIFLGKRRGNEEQS